MELGLVDGRALRIERPAVRQRRVIAGETQHLVDLLKQYGPSAP